MPLDNLAIAIAKLQDNYPASIDEAIALVNEALGVLPPLHPQWSVTLIHRGLFFFRMYNHTHDSNCLERAVDSSREAVNISSASAFQRFTAALSWAQSADARAHSSTLEAYQLAIDLLPHLATLGHSLQARQEILAVKSDGLARNGTACAIRSGEFGKAVEFLEHGRSTFWSQALRLRTPLDSLDIEAPEQAK